LYLGRRLLSFLPSNNLEDPPRVAFENNVDPNPELNRIIPSEPKQGYDVRQIICGVADRGDFLEVQPGFAPNIVIGLGRVLGRTIGVIANQSSVLSGVLDINAATKSARFIRFCNAFNIPLVTLSMYRVFCLEYSRNTAVSSGTERRCCLRTRRR